jgi:hypothetical protein
MCSKKEDPMSSADRVLVVFVASPSDLEAERNRLEDVIRELNLMLAQTYRVRLELVRWETHGYPGIGEDAQAVLNNQLPNDYDIFIGLMWSKFGTPTGRAESGTEEEFMRAHTRYKISPTSVKIMFYFKDAPLAPSLIDPNQLEKLHKFRSSLGEEGVLYWTFRSLEEFERLVRLHLTRQIQNFVSDRGLSDPMNAISVSPPNAANNDDLGIFELFDLVESFASQLKDILDRIGSETIALGVSIENRTVEINVAKEQSQGQISRRDAKILIAKAAADMNQICAAHEN